MPVIGGTDWIDVVSEPFYKEMQPHLDDFHRQMLEANPDIESIGLALTYKQIQPEGSVKIMELALGKLGPDFDNWAPPTEFWYPDSDQPGYVSSDWRRAK